MNNKWLLNLVKEIPGFLLVLSFILIDFLEFNIYWSFLFLPAAFFILIKYKSYFDSNLFWLISFSFLYASMLFFKGFSNDIAFSIKLGYILLPGSFYLFGRYIGSRFPYVDGFLFIQLLIVTLYCLIPFLSNIRSVQEQGFMSTRHFVLIGMELATSATNIGSHFALNLTLLPLFFIKVNTPFEKWFKYFSVILYAIGVFSTLNMLNRTGLVISATTLIVVILFSWQSFNKGKFILYFVFPVFVIIAFNIGNIVNWFESSFYFYRLTAFSDSGETSRFERWKDAIILLSKFPLGVYKLDIHYVHNLWLDVGKKTGFVGLIPLLLFTLGSVKSIFRVIKYSNWDIFAKSVVLCFSLGFLLTFFVEPIIEGYFIMFLIFCLFIGQIKSHEVSNVQFNLQNQ